MKCKPFRAGDIAIFQNLPFPFNFMNGEECEVLAPLQEFRVVDLHGVQDTVPCYKVSFRSKACGVLPEQLRHKKDPEDSISEHAQNPVSHVLES